MAITLVQKNGANNASSANATMPAWGTPTTVGNLLLIAANATSRTVSSAWTATPSLYTYADAANADFVYKNTTPFASYGLFWKRATGGDATPGVITAPSSVAQWVVYTYEFAAPGGWSATPRDTEVHSATGATAGTSKASGSTGTLFQANELAVAVMAGAASVSALSFTNSFSVDQPGTSDGSLTFGWQEVAATTALSTTASWTTSVVNVVGVATFGPAQFIPTQRRINTMKRRVGAGR